MAITAPSVAGESATPDRPYDGSGGDEGRMRGGLGGASATSDAEDNEEEEEDDIFHSARNLAAELEAGEDSPGKSDGGARESSGAPGSDGGGEGRSRADLPAAAAEAPRRRPPRWSDALSTPPASGPGGGRLRSPSLPDARGGRHGAGLRLAAERCRLLGKADAGRARLVRDACGLHDELLDGLARHRPSLAAAADGTPLGRAGEIAADRLSSYAGRTRGANSRIGRDAAGPWSESAAGLAEAASKELAAYGASRAACAAGRRDALRARRRYGDAARDAEGSVRAYERARRKAGGRRRRAGTDGSGMEGGGEGGRAAGDGAAGAAGPPSWTDDLRSDASSNGLARQAESVVRSADDLAGCLERYRAAVAAENDAVDGCQDAERRSLDLLQSLEEGRVLSVSGFLNSIVDGRLEALEGMSFETFDAVPVAIDEDAAAGLGTEVAPPQTPSSSSSGGGGLFMSPARRRAQSDDGPAINETRALNLDDGLAETRDAMRSTCVRQLTRLRSLRQLASFLDGLAGSVGSFATGLADRLDSERSDAAPSGPEAAGGDEFAAAWAALRRSLVSDSEAASGLGSRLAAAASGISALSAAAEARSRSHQEAEEGRWRALVESARVEGRALARSAAAGAELDRARNRVVDGGAPVPEDRTTPPATPNTKMDKHVNKAVGKIASIMGDDVMNKMLNPQQRAAVAKRQLDEAVEKERRAAESHEVAVGVKRKAVETYQTETADALAKFKSDERNEWDEMQTALVSTVDAFGEFRAAQLSSLTSSRETIRAHTGDIMLEDVARWTDRAERTVSEQREGASDGSEDASDADGGGADSGFALTVRLIDHASVEEMVRGVLDEAAADGGGDATDDDGDVEQAPSGDALARSNGESGAPSPAKDRPETAPRDASRDSLPDVPPDPLMGKMDSIFSKRLRNVTIDRYYAAGWSEEVPLCRPWLERKGSFDVSVTEWGTDGDLVNGWSGEEFEMRRTVKFKFKRTTHLYIGPPVAGVTQTQYIRREGNDRCVVMMTVEMDGIPYADSFAVEVRWSARRVDGTDISVDAGVFVRFIKPSMFASKIKSGTVKETSPIHLDLFEVIKTAIAEDGEGGEMVEVGPERGEENEVEKDGGDEAKQPTSGAVDDIATHSPIPQAQALVSQAIATVLSMPQRHQALLAVVLLYLVSRVLLLGHSDPSAHQMDELNRKVDDLTAEIGEIKVLIEAMLRQQSVGGSGGSGDEL